MPKGHSFACEGEAAVDEVPETRSHAVGQSSDKRTLLRGGRGQPVGLYAPLHLTELLRNMSVNCATAAGRESPEPAPAPNLHWLLMSMPFDVSPLDLHDLDSRKCGAHRGLAMFRCVFAQCSWHFERICLLVEWPVMSESVRR